ncbi:MAG: type III pantothenate kinase [bacterium]
MKSPEAAWLLIDAGNSALKWAVLESGSFSHFGVATYQQDFIADLARSLNALDRPVRVVIANVAGDKVASAIRSLVKDCEGVHAEFLSVNREANGVSCGYGNPSHLGIDRWAAIIAAYERYPRGACVVDCGTAVTIDGVTAEGVHLGGFILPGMDLGARCLLQGTQIPAPSWGQPATFWGEDTGEAIVSGAQNAITALVDVVLQKLRADHAPDASVVITGGSSERIFSATIIDQAYQPHLVFEGIRLLASDEV